jgi:hypothetical protein
MARDGEDVAVGQHHEPGAQSGDDFVLQAVGEVGGVIERHRDGAQGVALLGLLDGLSGQRRAGHAGVQDRVAVLLQPYTEPGDLRASADRVRTFDHNELAL